MQYKLAVTDVFCFIPLEKVTVMYVVLLQDSTDFEESETGYCSETCVTGGVGGTGEVSVNFEDSIDVREEGSIKFEAVYVKEEFPESTSSPPIMTEQEVRLWGVCDMMVVNDFFAICCPKTGFVKLNLTISHFLLYCLSNVPVEMWNAVLKGRDF
jgi:hypothetical protein